MNQAAVNTTPFPSDAIFKKIQAIIDTDNTKYSCRISVQIHFFN